jgi:hypothetical protein
MTVDLNLNSTLIPGAESDEHQRDFSTSSADGSLQVYFKEIEKHLIQHIHKADIVVGCVAWLTSEPILLALAEKKSVSIIVQKEDFLRPDGDMGREKTRKLYAALPASLERHRFGNTLGRMSVGGDTGLEAIRCVGGHNSQSYPAFPRSHHKFVVFCKVSANEEPPYISPYAVWTGSFNFSDNATRSFENALVLSDPIIVEAYYQEYGQIAAISESLDWTSEWVAPVWRIGT